MSQIVSDDGWNDHSSFAISKKTVSTFHHAYYDRTGGAGYFLYNDILVIGY